jgi:hypothetical protein
LIEGVKKENQKLLGKKMLVKIITYTFELTVKLGVDPEETLLVFIGKWL